MFVRFVRQELVMLNGLLVTGCVSGPGQPCGGDSGPRLFPSVGEEEEANRNMDGGLLCTVVWSMPGFAP